MNRKISIGLPLSVFVLCCILKSVCEAEPQKEPTAFEQALLHQQNLSTKESIVIIGERKFRRIEYKTNIFYLQLLADEKNGAELNVLCGDQGAQRFNSKTPSLISGSVKIGRRTRFFIEGLQTICSGEKGKERILLDPTLLVGFAFDDGDDSKALLRNKRVYINPFGGGLGFSADW